VRRRLKQWGTFLVNIVCSGPKIHWRSGRIDKKSDVNASEIPPNGRLPDAAQGASHLREVFYRMGFNDREIVALSGAHALGRCHTERSGFSGPWTHSPTRFTNQYFTLLGGLSWGEKVILI
jgi:cytochrome c peroxidase